MKNAVVALAVEMITITVLPEAPATPVTATKTEGMDAITIVDTVTATMAAQIATQAAHLVKSDMVDEKIAVVDTTVAKTAVIHLLVVTLTLPNEVTTTVVITDIHAIEI